MLVFGCGNLQSFLLRPNGLILAIGNSGLIVTVPSGHHQRSPYHHPRQHVSSLLSYGIKFEVQLQPSQHSVLTHSIPNKPLPIFIDIFWVFYQLIPADQIQQNLVVLITARYPLIFHKYRVSSNKRPRPLLNFETVKYGAYQRDQMEALISK